MSIYLRYLWFYISFLIISIFFKFRAKADYVKTISNNKLNILKKFEKQDKIDDVNNKVHIYIEIIKIKINKITITIIIKIKFVISGFKTIMSVI